MPFNLRGPEILILILIILLLFGAKRLPDVARGLGRSLRILKSETREMQGETPDAPAAVEATGTPAAAPLPPAPQAADAAPPATHSAAPAPAPQPERTES
ncbi:MAG: hypothetical protein B7C55_12155 [Actinomycetales bacterium mxb001]|nr:MAG: hypothetical protein B7C55_12155 [Actinomycetales bacterium mxb001]